MTSLSGFLHQIMRSYTPYRSNDSALSPGSSTVLWKSAMRFIDKIYIDGSFVTPHGTELFPLHNPATAQVIGRVRLAVEDDARTAIAAATRAFPAFARTSKAERIALLRRMPAATNARPDVL